MLGWRWWLKKLGKKGNLPLLVSLLSSMISWSTKIVILNLAVDCWKAKMHRPHSTLTRAIAGGRAQVILMVSWDWESFIEDGVLKCFLNEQWINAYEQLAVVRLFTQVRMASLSTGRFSCVLSCWGLICVLWEVIARVLLDTDIWCLASWEIIQEQPGSLKSTENGMCPGRFLSLPTVLKFVLVPVYTLLKKAFYCPASVT